jgi:hypothetical protein
MLFYHIDLAIAFRTQAQVGVAKRHKLWTNSSAD